MVIVIKLTAADELSTTQEAENNKVGNEFVT